MTSFSNRPEFTISNLLKALKSLKNLKSVHSLIIKLGLSSSPILITTLINLSLKLNLVSDAHQLFDELPEKDIIAWTSMVAGHAHLGLHHSALSFFRRMLSSFINPNAYTLSSALIACSGLKSSTLGKEIHGQIIKLSAFECIDIAVWNALIGMYFASRDLVYADKVFEKMSVKESITYNLMMSGYLNNSQPELSLNMLHLMRLHAIKPDDISYTISLDACSLLASLQQGVQIHCCVLKEGFNSDAVLTNSLLDMYAKCGCIASARLIFDTLTYKDSVLWTAMVSALGKCGLFREAIELFDLMGDLNIERDEIAYLVIMSTCSHGGLVNEGWNYFNKCKFRKVEHYGCMVDLLSRSGRLHEAMNLVNSMPMDPSVSIWISFLSSCRLHGNLELARFACAKIIELDPDNHSNLVALSGVHALERDWDESWRIREGMKEESVKKEPGCSWIELNGGVYVFLMGDKGFQEIFDIVQSLSRIYCESEYGLFEGSL